MKKVYKITSIEDYGKLISLCVNADVVVFRSYWDEREKESRCYQIDFIQKRLFYSSEKYYRVNGFDIVIPEFYLDDYGNYHLKN